MKYTILSVVFDRYDQIQYYTKLLNTFQESIKRNAPEATLDVIRMPIPEMVPGKTLSQTDNNAKLKIWCEYINQATLPVVLSDCDMLCLKDLSPAFEEENFDIGFIKKTTRSRTPINGGVIFVKPTEAARTFMVTWRDTDKRMFENRDFFEKYFHKYLGQNQSSFGYLLEHPLQGVKMLAFPSPVWDACEEDWGSIDSYTRMIHVKGQLRDMVLNKPRGILPQIRGQGTFYLCAELWKYYNKCSEGSEPSRYPEIPGALLPPCSDIPIHLDKRTAEAMKRYNNKTERPKMGGRGFDDPRRKK